jgi:nanoRNase/pAp phosphatase (c-di-AMP/oligoRNAs hydrolase)
MRRPSAAPHRPGRRNNPGYRRSDRFIAGLAAYDRVIFVSHVHPDPDSLGSMLGLAHLVETKLGLPTVITQDGVISRAENRAMVEVLHVDPLPLEKIIWQPGDAVVMVDSQPGTGRHSLPANVPVYAVIDHHETLGKLKNVSFVDVRPRLGATCTLVYTYLTEKRVPLTEKVATALLYGIETEVMGFPREASRTDDLAVAKLYPLADQDALAQIRHARLPHSHFEVLLQALQSSFQYDRLILSWVHDLPAPEQAAEIADFMIRFERVDWAVCAGVCNDKVILSVRSALSNAKAGDVLQAVVGRLGKAGGHDRRAGGCVKLGSVTTKAIEELQSELRRRFLKVLQIHDTRGRRLVPLRHMLQNLLSA